MKYSGRFLQFINAFLKRLIKLPQVIPIDEPVAHLKAHAQRFAAVFRYKLAPCDAGDGVVFVKIPLVGAAGQIKPRRGGNVDQRVRLAVLIQKALLCSALSFCGAAELVQRAGLGQCDDVELLTAGLQVGQRRPSSEQAAGWGCPPEPSGRRSSPHPTERAHPRHRRQQLPQRQCVQP